MQVRVLLYAGSRPRALPRWVQIALKPATKTLGLQGGIIRGKGRKYVMAGQRIQTYASRRLRVLVRY